jgi:hypothetical protein
MVRGRRVGKGAAVIDPAEPGPDPVAERVARNEATFREANERVARFSRELEREDPLPVLCECADPRCTNVVLVTHAEYEAVRAHPDRFVCDLGHVANAEGWGRVVSEDERFAVVEKLGEAAELSAELDPRTREAP